MALFSFGGLTLLVREHTIENTSLFFISLFIYFSTNEMFNGPCMRYPILKMCRLMPVYFYVSKVTSSGLNILVIKELSAKKYSFGSAFIKYRKLYETVQPKCLTLSHLGGNGFRPPSRETFLNNLKTTQDIKMKFYPYGGHFAHNDNSH